MKSETSYEKFIKARIIDHLIKRLPRYGLIVSEVPFSHYARRADLVVVANELHAIEIKAEYDNLTKLQDQLPDYQRFFERVTIFCAECHHRILEKQLPESVGLVVFASAGSSFRISRKGKRNPRITKSSWSHFLRLSEMRKLSLEKGLRQCGRSIEELREKLLTAISRKELRSHVLQILRTRYEDRFRIFLSERGKTTHADDVSLLKLSETTKIIRR